MSKIIIFGIQDFAELANFYLENDSEHSVAAFCVNKEYVPGNNTFLGKPVVPFEDVQKIYPKEEYKFFCPMSPRKMNKLRTQIYYAIKQKGYEFISYISSKATLWGNEIGENCFILEDNTIQPFTKIGNNVVLWSGNHIGHHGEIKDHVSFTSHVVMSGHCLIDEYCFLGVNSTIRDGVKLGKGTLVAMDASITKNTDEWSVYIGVPAKKRENIISFEVL